jgi:Spy/CpxP family protein refolding chaperone
MRTPMAIRLSLTFAIFLTVAAALPAQVPIPPPWNGYQAFWQNAETIKSLNLTHEQLVALTRLLDKANEQLQTDIRSQLTPEQQKKMQSLQTNRSQDASLMGLKGPDAQKVALALKVRRTAAQNYMILMNAMMQNAVGQGAQILQVGRSSITDPCKAASEWVIAAAPNLDSRQLKFKITLNDTSYVGTSCPEGMANIKGGTMSTVSATYPCAVTSDGVDLAPDCKFTVGVSAYQY